MRFNPLTPLGSYGGGAGERASGAGGRGSVRAARAILRTYTVELMAVVAATTTITRRSETRVFGIYIERVEGKLLANRPLEVLERAESFARLYQPAVFLSARDTRYLIILI